MYPTPDQVEWIRGYVSGLPGGWNTAPPEIVEAANFPRIPNPTPQPMRPRPFTITQLMGLLDPAAIGKLRTHPSLVRILDRVEMNDREACRLWLVLLQAGGDITAQQKASIESILDEVELDPDWPPLIGAAVAGIGRPLDQFDVLEAMP